MLSKLLLKENSKTQLAAAFIGTAVGFLLLLGAVQIYNDFINVLEKNDELIRPEYIILNKQLDLFGSASGFKPVEIEDIKKQPFVDDLTAFIVNEFQVGGGTKKTSNFPNLYSELFFESIPDEYLDVKDSMWKWVPGDTVIPVILPKDYLDLYNFGFAPAKGLPQVSGGIISVFTFDIKIRSVNGFAFYDAKIVGFSDRVNSILVPYSFLAWANKQYGSGESPLPSRLLIVSKDPSDPALLKYLNEKGYETNKEKLKNSKLKLLLQIILAIIGTIAFVIISLAFLVFMLGFQLMITKSKDKLRTLLYLGFHYLKLSRLYLLFFITIIAAVNIISYILLIIVKKSLTGYLALMGFELEPGLGWLTVLLGIVISVVIIAVNTVFIIMQIKKIGEK